ncbi:MAG TPA: hypothetical protein VEL82_04100 [Thermoplasmata archaeon]|nr:hypothetical protein [Thermoplasmata archaeon]
MATDESAGVPATVAPGTEAPAPSPPTLGRVGLPARAVTLLLGGLLLREAFSFWTGHPFDLEVWIRTGAAAARGVDPYSSFWPAVPGVSFAYLTQPITAAAYLPFWPALLGELYRLWEVVGSGDRFVLYFLLKQPPILADVATALLLGRLVMRWTQDSARTVQIVGFWSFFPYSIIITAIWGQFDSIEVVVVLALLFADSSLQRNVLYGIGIFVKWLTAIFLPLEILRERGARRLLFVVALALPAALTLAVFAAEGWAFTGLLATGTSQTHGGGLGMNYASLLDLPAVQTVLFRVPGFYTVAAYLWVPGIIVAGYVGAAGLRPSTPRGELRAMLLVVTTFLLLRWGVYEQYMLYLFSLLVLDVVVFHPGRRAYFRFTYALALVWLLVNNDLGIRFVSPLSTAVQPYTAALDQNDTWGLFRSYALIGLAVIVTVTLAQLLWAIAKDQERPIPWCLDGLVRVGRWVRRGTTA